MEWLWPLLAGMGLGWIVRDVARVWFSGERGQHRIIDQTGGNTEAPALDWREPVGDDPNRESDDSLPVDIHPFAKAPDKGEHSRTGDPMTDPDGKAIAEVAEQLRQMHIDGGGAPPDPTVLKAHAASLIRGEPVEELI